MKLLLQKADRFWDDLACGVDWYRDHASPEIAERFVDAIEVTLAGLLRTPEQAGFGSRNGRNWLAFVLSACSGLTDSGWFSIALTVQHCTLNG